MAGRPHPVGWDADPESVADTSCHINELLERIRVEEARTRLGNGHRAVVVSLDYERCPVSEAAAALGIPEGTMKSRAFYAVRELRLMLREMGVEH